MRTIAVLLTVFNRKEKTMKCLEELHNQLPLERYNTDIYLTNDGCTDGTPEAIANFFPQVTVINGKGNLFWNRGMYTAWEKAVHTKDYDFYLWLNDDTYLLPNALNTLLHESGIMKDTSIIVGSIRSEHKRITTYGGHNKNGKITPNGTMQVCDTFNGNCVLIPQQVYKKVGNLNWTFRHAIGDLDYGYRTREKNIGIYSTSQYIGICENNPKLPTWTRKKVSFYKRVKSLYSPLGYAEPIPFFRFEFRHFGLIIAVKHFISIHFRVCFPKLWK